MDSEGLVVLHFFHESSKPVIFDNGFHPVEGFKIDNNRLLLVPRIRDIFPWYCGHTGIIPVFMRECIKELCVERTFERV
jgi:hypothetical protein